MPTKRGDTATHTVVELREIAKDLGLTSFHRLRKSELEELVKRAMEVTSNTNSLQAVSPRDWQAVFSGNKQYIRYQGRKYRVTAVTHDAISNNLHIYLAYLINVDNPHNVLAVVAYLDPSAPSTSLNWGRWDTVIVKKIQ